MRYEIQAFNDVISKWNRSIHNVEIASDETDLELAILVAQQAEEASKFFDGDEATRYRVVEIQETVAWESK